MRKLLCLLSIFLLAGCTDSEGKKIAEQIKNESKLAKEVYCQKVQEQYKCTVVRQDDSVTTVYRR